MITYKDKTIEDILDEAASMVEFARKRVKMDPVERDDLLYAAHKEFYQSYPIPARTISQTCALNMRAMKRWLLHIKENKWSTEEQFIRAQAEFVVINFRFENPRKWKREIELVRANAIAALTEEHNAIKDSARRAKEGVEVLESRVRDRNARELHDIISELGEAGVKLAETVRVELDESIYTKNKDDSWSAEAIDLPMSADSILL